ncbi:MAG: hypothetical protein CVV64_14765 [Candidatus Wallbacteria bacterium HGW-Wallbacteria-1]|jgi:hypothetical protein|uniref:Uncharacterized protein n=1 Tax=Candidatus Wallbacteria bacterium HGW-Wallbacteria-1 TaxID=2013854 RepID=A0A2N1PLV6_9BACT|nr:MAG: hypothetical protein CVV64_14765 [Candidatus Wallbacteria bacterium HGW-Wallbacteria-1]
MKHEKTHGSKYHRKIFLLALLAAILVSLFQVFPRRDSYITTRHFLSSLNREKFSLEPRMISERRELSLQTLGSIAESEDVLRGINKLRQARNLFPMSRSRFMKKFIWTEIPASGVLRFQCLSGTTREGYDNLADWSETFAARVMEITSAPLTKALAELEAMIPEAVRNEEMVAMSLSDFAPSDSVPIATEAISKGTALVWTLREYEILGNGLGRTSGFSISPLVETISMSARQIRGELESLKVSWLRDSLKSRRLTAKWERAHETLQALKRKTAELKLEIGALPPPVTILDGPSVMLARSLHRIILNVLGTFLAVLILGFLTTGTGLCPLMISGQTLSDAAAAPAEPGKSSE